MAAEVLMPRLGWTMETGTIAEWLKRDGDEVRAGEMIFAVETDKVAQEVEAMDSGVLHIMPGAEQPGAEFPVGAVLGYLLLPGERLPDALGNSSNTGPAAPTDLVVSSNGAQEHAADAAPLRRRDEPAASPRARRVAGELGVDWTALTGSGRTGRIVERDVLAAVAAQQTEPVRTRVTPLARRVAQQQGVDVQELAVQSPGARITRADVEAAAPKPESAPPAMPGQGVPLGRVRRLIADRMATAAHTTAAVTLHTEADATELALVRARIKKDLVGTDRPTPSYSDLLARLVALALHDHPQLNSWFDGEAIVRHEAVHVGIAVDTEHGLLVPVVRDAQRKSVGAITTESAALIARARAGKSGADELHGSTFTITNLGMYDIDQFTPIINVPECAILGVGRITARQIVTDEEAGIVAIRKMVTLSLTFDHRVVDGGPAARFLQQIKQWIERPYAWLTS